VDALAVNKRTICRDLAALKEAGFPLVDDTRASVVVDDASAATSPDLFAVLSIFGRTPSPATMLPSSYTGGQ